MNNEELKLFIKDNNTNNNNNKEIIYPELNLCEVYSRYIKNFNLTDKPKEEKEINIDKIEESIIYIQNNINNLKEFHNDVSAAMNEKSNEIKSLVDLLNIFSDYEKNILIQYSKKDLTRLIFMNPENEEITTRINNMSKYLINPYEKFLYWIENDILDFKSMLFSLKKLQNLIILYNNTKSTLNEINKKIDEMKNKNESSYLNILMNCSSTNDKKIKDLIQEKEVIEKKVENLLGIINIIDLVNEKYIKEFKIEKKEKYNEQLKIFIEEDKNNRDMINNFWNCISEATKMKNPNKENKEQLSVSP